MEKEFVTYALAKAYKELGFDEPCFSVFDEMGCLQNEREMKELNLPYIKAPLWQQAEAWFMDKHCIIIRPEKPYGQPIVWALACGDGDFSTREAAHLKALELINH